MSISGFGRVCLGAVVGSWFVLGLVTSPVSLAVAAVVAVFVLFYRYAVASLMRAPGSGRGTLSWRRSGLMAAGVLVLGPTIAGVVTLLGATIGVPVVIGAFLLVLAVMMHEGWMRVTDGPARQAAAQPSTSSVSVSATTRGVPPPLPACSAELATDALCRAWRNSFVALERTPDAAAKARVVRMRHRYLDELERRDPVGFTRWLRDGARAAGDPEPYLTRRGPGVRDG